MSSNYNKLIRYIFKTDWLNSKPVFYNEKTKEVSYKILDVIDWVNFEWDLDGLNNYLQFGYCVFEATPVKDVKFLRHSSILTQNIDKNNKYIDIQLLDDPVLKYLDKTSSVGETINNAKRVISNIENKAKIENKNIILPLSGGHDSKFIACLLEDKSNITAYTYSLTLSENCFERVYGEEIAKRLGIKWNLLTLRDFMSGKYCDRAFDYYGCQMNLHAMYHMEMYDNIKNDNKNDLVISGIVMDAFAYGKTRFNINVQNKNDLFNVLGFTHGISIDREFIKIGCNDEYLEKNYNDNKYLLQDAKYRHISIIRAKMMLLSYLINTPKSSNFDVEAPALDIDFMMSQLCLPDKDGKTENGKEIFLKI